ncbi:hypothetical protein PG993_008920 [Apiospora rasikravindrae]|uniref:Monooxygenase n=1 Tax=Apiospora rasikravindrae TaxID=990691 RepID=A0ABR1SR45_9PEZI
MEVFNPWNAMPSIRDNTSSTLGVSACFPTTSTGKAFGESIDGDDLAKILLNTLEHLIILGFLWLLVNAVWATKIGKLVARRLSRKRARARYPNETSIVDITAGTKTEKACNTFDVVIVGAGISGINTAHRLKTKMPNLTFTILEGRGDIGGTWDMFRYPGVRTDSDMYTYGFSWNPWTHGPSFAKGSALMAYLRESIAKAGLGPYIRLSQRVESADWSSKSKSWALNVSDAEGRQRKIHSRFVVLGTGCFDYDSAPKPDIPGLDAFQGRVIHPQCWPEDYDHTGQRILVIGSGATAVTLLPSLAEKAAHVTMVQRSPTYIVPISQRKQLRLPASLRRYLFIAVTWLHTTACRLWPEGMRARFRRLALAQLDGDASQIENFTPRYDPWRQRLCFSPEGDFYAALRSGRAEVVTARIDAVVENGVRLSPSSSGDGGSTRSTTAAPALVEADAIVTATGMRMVLGGKIGIRVDGKRVEMGERLLWNSCMLQDVPNLFLLIGYPNASWTLGADNTALSICKLIRQMSKKNGAQVAIPRASWAEQDLQGGKGVSMWDLTSTYVLEAQKRLPKCGRTGPWRRRRNIIVDYLRARWGFDGSGLEIRG